jgi:hypothetical protein
VGKSSALASEPQNEESNTPAELLLERDSNINLHVDFGPETPEELEYDKDKVKFSNEHPAEAYRIRMKRKAMEEAALEAAYQLRVGELLKTVLPLQVHTHKFVLGNPYCPHNSL